MIASTERMASAMLDAVGVYTTKNGTFSYDMILKFCPQCGVGIGGWGGGGQVH